MLYKGDEVNYSKNPYTRTYSYRLSLTGFLLAIHNLAKCKMLYRRAEVNYSKNPHIRTYSYGLSLIRFLLGIHNLAKCCIGEVK